MRMNGAKKLVLGALVFSATVCAWGAGFDYLLNNPSTRGEKKEYYAERVGFENVNEVNGIQENSDGDESLQIKRSVYIFSVEDNMWGPHESLSILNYTGKFSPASFVLVKDRDVDGVVDYIYVKDYVKDREMFYMEGSFKNFTSGITDNQGQELVARYSEVFAEYKYKHGIEEKIREYSPIDDLTVLK